MYIQHPYKYNGKYYAKIDGEFHEISEEIARVMRQEYENEKYRSRKWSYDPDYEEKRKRYYHETDQQNTSEEPVYGRSGAPLKQQWVHKHKMTEILDCVFSENTNGIDVRDMKDGRQMSPEEKMIFAEETADLYTKIDSLSEHERFIIDAIYFKGMKQVELAKILDISPVRMNQKLKAILKKMRKMYDRENVGSDTLNILRSSLLLINRLNDASFFTLNAAI